jgi:hypothetical protein
VFEEIGSGNWRHTATLLPEDSSALSFGLAVGLYGNKAIVGAPRDSAHGPTSGAAYVYERDALGTWHKTAKLTASDAAPYSAFGAAVSIDNTYAIVGAWGRNTMQGGAYAFEEDCGGNWCEAANLSGPDGVFGLSVAQDGSRALVGSARNNAMLYERSGDGAWTLTDSLVGVQSYTPYAVSLNGPWAAVGNPYDSTLGPNAGAVLLFHEDEAGNWSQVGKIFASDGGPDQYFGAVVDLDGTRLLAAADHFKDKGAGYLFSLGVNNQWQQIAQLTTGDAFHGGSFGYAGQLDGHNILISDYSRRGGGMVYAYHMPEPSAFMLGMIAALGAWACGRGNRRESPIGFYSRS